MRRTLLTLWLVFLFSGTIWGQAPMRDSTLPPRSYYIAVAEFNNGDVLDALKDFQSGWRGSLKISTNRWIDAICHASMSGECLYQMGKYPEALEQYTSALELFLQWSNWLTFINNVPDTGAGRPLQVPWGDPKPGRQLRKVPETLSILFGDPEYNTRTYKSGDVVMPPTYRQIRADEIVRCTALAIRRRGDLLGPLAHGDALHAKLISSLNKLRQAMQGSWLQVWVDIQLGLAYIANGRDAEGVQCLMRGALINNADHSLSSSVHLVLGEQAMRVANYEQAIKAYLEAATLAFHFEDPCVMEEAFRGLQNAYYQKNAAQVCPPLAPAEAWAKREKLHFLRATLWTLLADENLRKKQTSTALACLKEAESIMGKRSMRMGMPGARLLYLQAAAHFLDSTPAAQKAGEQEIQSAMQFLYSGSVWNFQIQLVDNALLSGKLTPRRADEYYSTLLREPTAADWATHPMESLSALVSARDATWENWFLVAMEMEKPERALEIAERAKRAKFLQWLNFGGRIHALRLLLEVPEGELSVAQAQRRRDILTEFPEYTVRAKKVAKLWTEIRSKKYPLAEEDAKLVQDKLKELSQLSTEQETILSGIVLERRLIDILFPPIRTSKELQAGLPAGETMLVFYVARGRLFVFMLNNENFTNWEVRDTAVSSGKVKKTSRRARTVSDLASLQNGLVQLLKEVGLTGPNAAIKGAKLKDGNRKDSKWKELALQAMTDLVKSSKADFSQSDFTSLVVVPDRFMWYLPFEMLQVQTPKGLRPTINQFSVRYAPTASLGIPWKKWTPAVSPYTAIAYGKEEPHDTALTELREVVGRPVEMDAKDFGGVSAKCPSAVSPVFAPTFDRLLVMMDLKNNPAQPFAVSPMGVDAALKGSTLGDWFALPYGAPRIVALTGFHTLAEEYTAKESKRGKNAKGPALVPGQELFLTSMTFFANGADVVVLSRWRMGGDSSYLLMKLFFEYLKKESSTPAAWRKAILKLAGTELQLEYEPRINAAEDQPTAEGACPAFWAGYLLLGGGAPLSKDAVNPDVPAEVAPADGAPADPPAEDDVPAIVVPEEQPEEEEEQQPAEQQPEEAPDAEKPAAPSVEEAPAADPEKTPRKRGGRRNMKDEAEK